MPVKTFKAWLGQTHRNMITHSKHRKMELPEFTKEELRQWVIENCFERFNILFSEYIKSGYDKNRAVSINRINDYKTYSLDNIELMTWEENNIKGRFSKKTINEVHRKLAKIARDYYKKPIEGIDKAGNIIKYEAIRDAIIDGFDSSAIVKVCKGKLKTHKGYCWRYSG